METREQYKTFADEPSQPLFMVELIDAQGSGKSHGYIGYRFHAVGAQAAADSWNNNRDRGDLVAVIKPVQEPTPPVQHAQIVKARRDHLALEEIGKLLGMRVIEREDRSVIIDNVRKLAEAIKNPIATPGVSMFSIDPKRGSELAEKLVQSIQSGPSRTTRIVMMDDPTSQLRSHKQLLIKSLEACTRAMDNGKPLHSHTKRWQRARMLAEETLAAVSD